jgi:hypothetical protein
VMFRAEGCVRERADSVTVPILARFGHFVLENLRTKDSQFNRPNGSNQIPSSVDVWHKRNAQVYGHGSLRV